MSIAVIDVGSGSVRMLLEGKKTTIMTKLGEGLNASGRLGEEPVKRTVDVIKKFAEEARTVGAQINVFATEAVRAAENSADFIDNKADDVFYYGQGKAYAYYLLFNALGRDYKEIIVKKDAYGIWTSMLKALEDASKINPSVIRNGRLDSFGAPNHLAALGFYILKAQTLMNRINDKINISSPNKE